MWRAGFWGRPQRRMRSLLGEAGAHPAGLQVCRTRMKSVGKAEALMLLRFDREWNPDANVYARHAMVSALTVMDRLMHRSTLLEFEGRSYRLKEAAARMARDTSND